MTSLLLYFFLSLSIRLNYIIVFYLLSIMFIFFLRFTAETASEAISWETSEVISLDIKHYL